MTRKTRSRKVWEDKLAATEKERKIGIICRITQIEYSKLKIGVCSFIKYGIILRCMRYYFLIFIGVT